MKLGVKTASNKQAKKLIKYFTSELQKANYMDQSAKMIVDLIKEAYRSQGRTAKIQKVYNAALTVNIKGFDNLFTNNRNLSEYVEMVKQSKTKYWIGIQNERAYPAEVIERGAIIPVTEKMSKKFAAEFGIPLKVGSVLRIPPRPIWNYIAKSEQTKRLLGEIVKLSFKKAGK